MRTAGTRLGTVVRAACCTALLFAWGCSSTSSPPCGGVDTCPSGYGCQDRGSGYRCYADDPGASVTGAGHEGGTHSVSGGGSGATLPGAPGALDDASIPDAHAAPMPMSGGEPDAATPPVVTRCAASITFVIDGSGSMCEVFGDSTRWQAVRAALLEPEQGLIPRLQGRVDFGLTVFDGTIDALVTTTTPSQTPGPACAVAAAENSSTGECPRLAAVAPAADNAAAIEAAYPTVLPGGSTPTDKALTGVVDRELALAPGIDPALRPRSIVLITDGLPNDICTGGLGGDGVAQQNAMIAEVDRAAASSVTTYVVSMFGTDPPLDAFLTALALRGAPNDPSAHAYEPATPEELSAALDEIAGDAPSCER